MLQLAAKAPALLPDSASAGEFLRGQLAPGGLFADRAGGGDLYYSVFGLQSAMTLGLSELAGAAAGSLAGAKPDQLDLVHLCCLTRCQALLATAGLPGGTGFQPVPLAVDAKSLAERLEGFRSRDGGYSLSGGADHGSVYAAFMAFGAWGDLGRPCPNPRELTSCLLALRQEPGCWINEPAIPLGNVPATAAATIVLAELGQPPDQDARQWLLAQARPDGGFALAAMFEQSDLLSTAVALAALRRLEADLSPLAEGARRYVLGLWDRRGAFHPGAGDPAVDCEYLWYGLLALGCLA
jgi:hypothetical protein